MWWPLEARKSLRRTPRALIIYLCCLLTDFAQTLHVGSSLSATVDDLLHGLYNQRPNRGHQQQPLKVTLVFMDRYCSNFECR